MGKVFYIIYSIYSSFYFLFNNYIIIFLYDIQFRSIKEDCERTITTMKLKLEGNLNNYFLFTIWWNIYTIEVTQQLLHSQNQHEEDIKTHNQTFKTATK